MTRGLGLDTFSNGGQLVDLSSWYAGRDKVQHVVCGMVLARLVHHLAPWSTVFAVMLLLVVWWELLEVLRYLSWRAAVRRAIKSGAPTPAYPMFADTFSWRDVVATMVGAFIAVIL